MRRIAFRFRRPPLHCDTRTMDPTWLLVVLMLIVLFASISIVGALRRIRVATEKTLAILETQTTGEVNRLAR
jgi:hypothetical protein